MVGVLTVHVGATWFMTGVIWFVQLVHYPLFAAAAGPSFAAYHRLHLSLVTWIVAPAMLVELATGLLLAWAPPPGLSSWTTTAGLLLLAFIWLSTAFVQVPGHNRLRQGFDAAAHRRLVASNWIRTIAWSARALILSAAVVQFAPAA
jgi:hypothetical protein